MELTIQVATNDEAMALFGLGDRNLKLLRDAFEIQVTGRGRSLKLVGEKAPVEEVAGILNAMIAQLRSGSKVSPNYLENELEKRKLELGSSGQRLKEREEGIDERLESSSRATEARSLTPEQETEVGRIARSRGQEAYLQAIQKNPIVFCIGPAGTGKTYLAVRMAVSFLRGGGIRKLILCRPAVEAGEKLGFLPGDFQAKINPYLRPLYDALNEILDYDQVKRYVEREIIEIIPLAYMRGRTLNNAFIILDEGQNTSISQMKMFLTRMGMNSRIVVNGDVTQVDLPEGQPSGLVHARKIIREIPGIDWIQLEKADIVRHPLVKRIVEAYEGAEGGSG